MDPTLVRILTEAWTWVKGAVIIYAVVAAIVAVLTLVFIIKVFRGLMKDF